MRSRILKFVALLMSLTFMAAACGDDSAGQSSSDSARGASDSEEPPSSSDDPFTIVFVGGRSGPTAELYANLERAINLAIEDINDKGGILGREVRLDTLDSQADQTRAVTEIQNYLSDNEPDVVFAGAANSAEILSVAPVVARNGIPTLGLGSSPLLDDPESYPLVRSLAPGAHDQIRALKEQVDVAGYGRLVALTPQDAFGEGLNQAFDDNFADSDVDIVKQQFDAEALDLTTAFQRAVDTGPDVIFLDCVGAPCPRLLDARSKVPGATDIPVIAGLGFSQVAVPAEFGSEDSLTDLTYEVFLSQVADEGPAGPNYDSFIERYSEGADGEVKQIALAMLAYDAIKMTANAAEVAGSTEGDALIEAFGTEFGGAIAVVEYIFEEGKSVATLGPESFAFLPGDTPQVDGLYVPE